MNKLLISLLTDIYMYQNTPACKHYFLYIPKRLALVNYWGLFDGYAPRERDHYKYKRIKK